MLNLKKYVSSKRKTEPNRFKYIPRFLKEENELKLNSRKYKDFENNYSSHDRRNNWKNALEENHTNENRDFNKRVILIVAVLLFIVLWILDFDLSIFTN